MNDRPRYAMSVTGPVSADALGVTLAHEHLNIDGRFLATGSGDGIVCLSGEQVRREPMRFPTNLDLRSPAVAQQELQAFADAGGTTLVDLTPDMMSSRDPWLLRRLSEATGVTILMGAGWYVGAAHPPHIRDLTGDQLADILVEEIEEGVTGGIRPGVIGEIGTGDPLLPAEERVVEAAALAHLRTGCPLNIHLAAGARQSMRVLDVIEAAGVSHLGRVILSHVDVQIDLGLQRELIGRGAIVEYDTFGHERYPDSRGYRMPTDRERVEALVSLHESGLLGSVLVSQDVCLRSLWTAHGGTGYAHVLGEAMDVADELGIGDVWRHTLLRDNPARVLCYLDEPGRYSSSSMTT